MSSTLSVKNASYRYRSTNTAAVKEINCDFDPGQLYAIIGPSGSGKTTLLSLLAGLDLPTGGDVLFDGRSLRDIDLDRYRSEDVSMIFQAFHLMPLMTAIENVCYPLELRGARAKDVRPFAMELLESVGISPEQMKRYPSRLSGGEQQRVAIARSLATGAKVILADEPTGNLDIANAENIMEILHELAHNKGYCIIIVTHNLEIAEAADVIYQIRDGKLLP